MVSSAHTYAVVGIRDAKAGAIHPRHKNHRTDGGRSTARESRRIFRSRSVAWRLVSIDERGKYGLVLQRRTAFAAARSHPRARPRRTRAAAAVLFLCDASPPDRLARYHRRRRSEECLYAITPDPMNDSLPSEAPTDKRDVRIIAFYLPQFHPISENDLWWGKDFTEWTNVRKATPNFRGHYQPHIPGELGYYDLRDPGVRERQAALARQYGIHGFCYYYYWFNGKRLLERPLDDMLSSARPEFPFCVCWANENWTRRWDGRDSDILMAQQYSIDDSREFIRSLFPLFRDKRYIRVNGKPLLLIYKANLIPELARTVAMWRDECRNAGIEEIYAVAAMTSGPGSPSSHGFDAAVEFPPHGHMAELINERLTFTNRLFDGMVFNLRNYVAQLLTMPRPEFKLFRTLIPSWDNTPRQQDRGTAFVGSSPELFEYWLEQALHQTCIRHHGDERLIFINAWNEWGEGCHLEPDQRYGRGYLQAIASALAAPFVPPPMRPGLDNILAHATALKKQAAVRQIRSPRSEDDPERRPPRISVVMPAYNHERFVRMALDSVVAQTLDDLEIVVIDDGSSDGTAAILDAFVAQCTRYPVTVVHQPNEGAYAAINHGMALARGEIISIINSDDMYAPTRLAKLLSAMDEHGAGFAFSGTRFIDDEGAEFADDSSYVGQLRDDIARCKTAPNPLHELLSSNVAISTGNFCFRRDLLTTIGGFGSFRMCHDWDFILAASYLTPIRFVHESLYEYRLHQHNTFAGLRLLGHAEADHVLARFFEDIERHPAMLDPASRQTFLNAIRRRGFGGFLPAALRAA
ncbi:MAG: glycoside hydrolase family 99-like domain-containing protein [Betaproteobacteria bacterium]